MAGSVAAGLDSSFLYAPQSLEAARTDALVRRCVHRAVALGCRGTLGGGKRKALVRIAEKRLEESHPRPFSAAADALAACVVAEGPAARGGRARGGPRESRRFAGGGPRDLCRRLRVRFAPGRRRWGLCWPGGLQGGAGSHLHAGGDRRRPIRRQGRQPGAFAGVRADGPRAAHLHGGEAGGLRPIRRGGLRGGFGTQRKSRGRPVPAGGGRTNPRTMARGTRRAGDAGERGQVGMCSRAPWKTRSGSGR